MDSRSVLVHTIPDDWLATVEPVGSSEARRLAGTGGATFSHTSKFEYRLASLNLRVKNKIALLLQHRYQTVIRPSHLGRSKSNDFRENENEKC